MSLKRRNKVEATFAMSSMTDLIFLLLLFFVMASTMSSPAAGEGKDEHQAGGGQSQH